MSVAIRLYNLGNLPYSFSEGEIHFNLMAIVGDRRKRFQKEIDRLETRQDTAAKMVCMQSQNIKYHIVGDLSAPYKS